MTVEATGKAVQTRSDAVVKMKRLVAPSRACEGFICGEQQLGC